MVKFCKPFHTLLINLFHNATSDDSLKKYLDKLGFTKQSLQNKSQMKQKQNKKVGRQKI